MKTKKLRYKMISGVAEVKDPVKKNGGDYTAVAYIKVFQINYLQHL